MHAKGPPSTLYVYQVCFVSNLKPFFLLECRKHTKSQIQVTVPQLLYIIPIVYPVFESCETTWLFFLYTYTKLI